MFMLCIIHESIIFTLIHNYALCNRYGKQHYILFFVYTTTEPGLCISHFNIVIARKLYMYSIHKYYMYFAVMNKSLLSYSYHGYIVFVSSYLSYMYLPTYPLPV